MGDFNPPAKVRAALYVLSAVGSVVVSYLSVKHYVGDAEVALWSGLVAVIGTMAGLNVGKSAK